MKSLSEGKRLVAQYKAALEKALEENQRLREALETIRDKAPWCDCMDAHKIASDALEGK